MSAPGWCWPGLSKGEVTPGCRGRARGRAVPPRPAPWTPPLGGPGPGRPGACWPPQGPRTDIHLPPPRRRGGAGAATARAGTRPPSNVAGRSGCLHSAATVENMRGSFRDFSALRGNQTLLCPSASSLHPRPASSLLPFPFPDFQMGADESTQTGGPSPRKWRVHRPQGRGLRAPAVGAEGPLPAGCLGPGCLGQVFGNLRGRAYREVLAANLFQEWGAHRPCLFPFAGPR